VVLVVGEVWTSIAFVMILLTVSWYVSPPAASLSMSVSLTSKCSVNGVRIRSKCDRRDVKNEVCRDGRRRGRERERKVVKGEGVGMVVRREFVLQG